MTDILNRYFLRASFQMIAALLIPFCASECLGGTVFTNVQGKVLYSPDGQGSWAQAKPGLPIKYGSKIKTGWLSWAEIRYEDSTLALLGPESELAVYTAKAAESFSKLNAGLVRVVIKNTATKFSVRTPAATINNLPEKSARYSVLDTASGKTRVQGLSGEVSVLDAKSRETKVKADEALIADADGAGRPEVSQVGTINGAWVIAPPYGFAARGSSRWELVSDEISGFDFKLRHVTLEHYEALASEKRDVNWKTGEAWPAKCAGDALPNEVHRSMAEGRPFFYYSCPAADLSRAVWQDRYYEVPLDPGDGNKTSVIRLHYTHRVQAKLPPPAELRRLYGPRTSAEYFKRYQADVMPLVAEGTSKTKVDGPSVELVLESVLTLYQEGWAGKDEYSGKVVPSIE